MKTQAAMLLDKSAYYLKQNMLLVLKRTQRTGSFEHQKQTFKLMEKKMFILLHSFNLVKMLFICLILLTQLAFTE